MMSTDIFNAAEKICSVIDGLSPDEIRKTILMVFVAIEEEGLLVDGRKIAFAKVTEDRSSYK